MSTTHKIFPAIELFVLSLTIIAVLLGQWVGKKINPIDALSGAALMMVACSSILLWRYYLPKLSMPAFAFVLTLGLVLSLPQLPIAKHVMELMTNIDFLATTPPILAVAGISMGNSFEEIKKAGWKIIVLSTVVFLGTYLLSSFIAHVVLKIQGII